MSLQWTTRLSLGIDTIDKEHQQLVRLINDLDAAIKSGRPNDTVGQAIDKLSAYTVLHFGREERLFAQHAYPDAAAHKAQHAEFIAKVAAFKAALTAGKLGVSYQVMSFLEDWTQRHIMATDRKYVAFFAEKNVVV